MKTIPMSIRLTEETILDLKEIALLKGHLCYSTIARQFIQKGIKEHKENESKES